MAAGLGRVRKDLLECSAEAKDGALDLLIHKPAKPQRQVALGCCAMIKRRHGVVCDDRQGLGQIEVRL